ncbi:putative Mechanosensitive ion channel protein 10 [Nannochloris sp. 'desiccata']|nr:putative Mechanosensitive ion channel protein 10 [Chlorella desiccata (nom. nud.)]
MNDHHAAFQQFAAQAMVASNAMAANQQRNVGSTAAVTSQADETDHTQYSAGAAGQSGRRQQNPCSPVAARCSGQQRGSTYAARFSMPPTAINPDNNTKDRPSSNFRPDSGAAAGVLPRRPYRPSTQSRRSEQVYAGRRSAATAFGRHSVATARGSTYTTTTDTTGFGSGEDVDDLDWNVDRAPNPRTPAATFWRWFWIVVPIIISLTFTTAGVLYLVYGSHQMVSNLQIWRMCFFIAGLPVIWWIGEGVTLGSVWIVERSKLFKMQNALYFAYAVRRPLANVLRAVLALGWWALAMTAWTTSQDSDIKEAFQVVLKIWACVTLFMTANLLKTLLAKMLSSKFNKESHVHKIQDSLVKEYHLHMLLQPRNRFGLAAEGRGAAGSSEFPSYNGGGADGTAENGVKMEVSGVHNVHASGGIAAGNLDDTIVSSMRGVTNKLFGGLDNARSDPIMGTSGDELLDSSEPRSPSEGSVAAGVAAAEAVDLEAAHNDVHHYESSLRSVYGRSNTTPLPKQPHEQRPGSVGGRQGTHRSSTQRSAANSLVDETAPLHRQHCFPSVVNQGRRLSRLAPVVEQAAGVTKHINPRGLTENQIAKMEAYVRRHALQVNFQDELSATERQEEVTTEAEAKKLALFLFWNVKSDLNSSAMVLDDVADFLPQAEAEQAFAMLDRNGNGSVSLSECIAAVVEIFEARCDLALSLSDTKTVIGKLENVIGVVLHIIFVFLYMLVFNVDVVKTYLALSSLILAFSFVFQNSIRTIYENVVFLFVVHPFDVGDYLVVGEGDNAPRYKVDQIDLHYTIFLAGNGSRTWYPNNKLMITPFSNITASGERGDSIKFVIDMDTPAGVLDAVRAACEATVAANPTEFAEGVVVNISDAGTPMKLTLVIGFKYSTNGAEGGRCARARTLMQLALAEALIREGVMFTNPPTRDWPQQLHCEQVTTEGEAISE